jgi:hypothetical protein
MGNEKRLECPGCGVQLVVAIRGLDPAGQAAAAKARWATASVGARRKQAELMVAGREAKRQRAAEPMGKAADLELDAGERVRRRAVELGVGAEVVCQKCGHVAGCDERLRCRCLHRYGA